MICLLFGYLQVLVGKMRIVCVGDGCLWPLLLLLQQSKMDTPPRHFYYLSNCSHSTNVTKQASMHNGNSLSCVSASPQSSIPVYYYGQHFQGTEFSCFRYEIDMVCTDFDPWGNPLHMEILCRIT